MPTVALLDGVKIKFYHDDHAPPHFHASYGEFEAQIEIATLDVIAGSLPRTQLRLVKEWARSRIPALSAAWSACMSDRSTGRIE
ncbi:hypothetical protein HNR47_003429 [Methylopila jiangsuensis]|uniref:DUF4160 domain-containing protein n=1 Tax=Methylopila jiangsuensis TaxID=586230 RepID=UPI0022F2D4C1|nr:DUF4160 domain-containing protein [Methylopila jiangsuensis]MDR6287399.1 hypothetical protein [Methylopila jiangsuensis]